MTDPLKKKYLPEYTLKKEKNISLVILCASSLEEMGNVSGAILHGNITD